MANKDEELKKEEELKRQQEEALRNADIVRDINALAQNDALNGVESDKTPIVVSDTKKNEDSIIYLSEGVVSGAPTIYNGDASSNETPIEIAPAEQNAVEPEQVESNAETMQTPAEAPESEQEQREEDFQDLLNEKFAETIKEEKEKLDSQMDAIKKAHKNDYDSYVEKLKNTKYYKKSLEKWTKYYSDLKQQCAQEVKNDIDALAKDSAIEDKNDITLEPDVISEKKVEAKPETEKEIKVPNTNVLGLPEKTNLTADKTVDELEVGEYVALATDGKMLINKNLRKTVEEVLIDAFYTSFDEISDYYNRLNADTNENKKDNKIVEFRNELANNLQQVHNKVFPNATKAYMPYVDAMQKDIENRKDNMNINSISEQVFDYLYHIDTQTKQASGFIPKLADQFSAMIQDILLDNQVLDFNLSKNNVEKLLNRIVDEYKIGEALKEKNSRSTGIVESADLLSAEIKAIKNGEYVHDTKRLASYMNKIGENINKLSNTCACDTASYAKLFNVTASIERCGDIISQSPDGKMTAEAKELLSKALVDLNDVKTKAKASDSLNAKTDKRLMKETDKAKSISDYFATAIIKKATNDFQNDKLKTFDSTTANVDSDDIFDLLNSKAKTKTITSDTLDAVNLMIQEFIVKHEDEYFKNQNKIDSYLDEVTRFTAVLEEDEATIDGGDYTLIDLAKVEEDQKYAKVLVADFTHIQKAQNKKNLTNSEVENLDLGLVR